MDNKMIEHIATIIAAIRAPCPYGPFLIFATRHQVVPIMLGKNLGKKVGADFINKEYHKYLKKNDEKRTQRKTKSLEEEKSKESERVQQSSSFSDSGEAVDKKRQKETGKVRKREEMRKKGIFVQAYSEEEMPTEIEKPKAKKKKKKKSEKGKIESQEKEEESRKKEKQPTLEVHTAKASTPVRSNDEKKAPSQPAANVQKEATESLEEHSAREPSRQLPVDKKADTDKSEASARKTSERRRKDYVFAALEEDVDLMKVLEEFDLNTLRDIRPDDKRSLEAARKILKVAFREKEFEKALTPEENDVITKFFSGKIPYDGNVLKVMDAVLDKTIDHFKAHKTDLDPEIKRLIDEREALKAAMLQTMLSMPKFIPSSWVKQYEAYRQEAEKETAGINWAKIFLLYPRERAFDDGAADAFGNFTRARRGHWLWGCIFGPNDSKTFEEVDREIKSQSFFMDTAIIAKASAESTEPPNGDAKSPIVTSQRKKKVPVAE